MGSDYVKVGKGTYGTPWSKLAGQSIEVTPDVMNDLGKAILEGVRYEIKRAVALSSGLRGRGKPIPIPDSSAFIESFRYVIRGQKTVEIETDWPFAKVWEKGKDAYEMTWLRQPKVKVVPIITTSGETILRTAPFQTEKSWIHPGFAKYGFLQKGIKRGRRDAMKIVKEKLVLPALKGNDAL